MTAQLLAEPRELLLPLLQQYRWLPFSRFYGARSSRVAEWIYEEQIIKSMVRDDLFLETPDEDKASGIATLSARDWESDIYGFSMAEIPLMLAVGDHEETSATYDSLLASIEYSARDRNYQFLSCRTPAEDISAVHSLQNSGYLLMDTTIEFHWRPKRLSKALPKSSWEIRPAKDSDHEQMEDLSKEAFRERTHTRFGADRQFSAAKTEKLYAEWYRKSADGSFADCVLIAESECAPVGFITGQIEESVSRGIGRRVASIGISAVEPQYEGRGALVALVNALLEWCAARNVQCLRSRILVNNSGCVRGALKTGGLPGASYHTFHKWL